MLVDKNQDPAAYVYNLYEATKRWRQPYEDRWKRFYKLYRSWRDPSSTPFKSNIFVPYIFSIIESVVPKMLGTIFNTRPIVATIPRKGAAEGMATLLERLLEYQFDEERLELFNKTLEFFKETAVYGTSFLKVIPKFNDDEQVTFSYIDVEPLDLFNVFPDYRAKSVRRMKYIIQLAYVEYDELLRLQEQGFYENVSELLNHTESLANVDQYKKERLSSVGILDEYGFDSERKIVELLEYWDQDKIIVVGAKNFVLKIEDNPFKGLLPFVMARYIPVQHELYGIGIPEVAESLQEELNTVRNQRMDNVNLIINRMWIANKYADIDFDNMVSYPGNIILANDINAVKPLDTRDITRSAYLEEDIIKRDIDQVTGEWCMDFSEADVLTRDGWKPFSAITLDTEVATRTKDGILEYHKPDAIPVFAEKERVLYRIKSRNIEGDFTPEHAFPVVGFSRKYDKNKYLTRCKPGWKDKDFIQLKDITPSSAYKVPLQADWVGVPRQYKELSDGTRIAINEWVAFLGIYLAEGWAAGSKDGTSLLCRNMYRIGICQKPGTRWLKDIEDLLSRIGFKYCQNGKDLILRSNKALWEELFPLGNSHEKYIPQEIKDLPKEQLQILVDWMIRGDGWQGKHPNYIRTRYYTASKRLADDFQEVLIKLGFNGSIIKVKPRKSSNGCTSNGGYVIEIKQNKYAWLHHKGKPFISQIKKTCKVGCLTVKNHTFMVRINGKAFWTGNSYARGEPPERRETATGIVRLQQAANIRFDTVVKMLEFTVIRSIAKMFLWLDYHFLPPDEFARIVGVEEFERYNGMSFYQQDIDELLKQYNFQPMGSATTAIKEVRIQQIMQAFRLFNNDPFIDQVELRKMVLDVLDIKNVSRLLRPEQAQMLLALRQAEAERAAMEKQGQRGGKGREQQGSTGEIPPPGSPPTPPEVMMQELARVSGGGLLNRATGGPQPVGGQRIGG